ncbi:MAG: DUF6056 family protein [Acidobacteriota bacterium]|nr:DUF6056 family protein [Acidobacteriota bacterium]
MTRRPTTDELVAALFLAALTAALVALAYVGLYARYMADDYCTADSLHKLGFLAFQRRWYTEWTGRFSFSLLLAAAEWVGPAVVPYLSATAIACWVAGAVWSVYRVAILLALPRPLLTSLLLGELVVFATLNGAHNIAQSLYWQSGMLTYTPPLILFTFFLGVACRAVWRRLNGRTGRAETLACGGLALVAGGFSESHALLQVGALALALFALYLYAPAALRRAALPPVFAGLACALAAGCVVVLAPGNAVRMSYFPPHPNLLKLTAISLFYTAGFIAYTAYLSPLTTLMSAALPALLSFQLHRGDAERNPGLSGHAERDPGLSRRVWPGLSREGRVGFRRGGWLGLSCVWVQTLLPPLLVGFVLIFLCTVPGVYGTSTYLPGRARLIPQFVFVCVAVWCGWLAGVLLSERVGAPSERADARTRLSPLALAAASAASVILLLPPVAAARRTLSLAAGAREAAATWDETDRNLRAARGRGELDVTVAPVDDVETRLGAAKTELQIEHDAQNWKNKCAARYYGINSLRAE